MIEIDSTRAVESRWWDLIGRNDPCRCGSGRKFKRCCGAARTEHPKAGSGELDFEGPVKVWETALDRHDSKFTGSLLAAAEMVQRFILYSSERHVFERHLEEALRYANFLASLGLETRDIPEFLFVRLPFDLISEPFGTTPAAHFLDRFGRGLPGEAVEGVSALLAAEDSFVEVQRGRKKIGLCRLADSVRLPWDNPLEEAKTKEIFLGRLVQFRGRFVLFTPELMDEVTRSDHDGVMSFYLSLQEMFLRGTRLKFVSARKNLHLLSVVARKALAETAQESLRSSDSTTAD